MDLNQMEYDELERLAIIQEGCKVSEDEALRMMEDQAATPRPLPWPEALEER